jgi:hypothetical protein
MMDLEQQLSRTIHNDVVMLDRLMHVKNKMLDYRRVYG